MIIQDVDREEEQDIDEPSPYGYSVLLEEKWRFLRIELGAITSGGNEKKLYEGQ